MPAALAIGGASIASAVIGADAADRASDRQANAAANALAVQERIYNQNQANFKPYLDVGKGATYTLGQMYGIGQDGSTGGTQDYSKFYDSPDYKFAQEQGSLGLDRYLNAKGMALSGGALKDVAQFNQGLATQQFGNYYGRLMQLSQLGSGAASASAGNGANFAAQMGNSIQGIGQAQASGIVGSANAITGGINNGMNNSLLYNAINRSSYAPATNPAAGNAMWGGGGGSNALGWF